MARLREVQSFSMRLPRIGDMIEEATDIPYESYKGAQQTLGLEAAMAAIASNPDYRHADGRNMAEVVHGLLHKQARMRMDAVINDMQAVTTEELHLLGKPQSSYLMVQMVETAPAGYEQVLDRARKGVKDGGWLRAEGASNASNFARDVLATLPYGSFSGAEAGMFNRGVKAADRLVRVMSEGLSLPVREQLELEQQLGHAMDMAVNINPLVHKNPAFRTNYDHYRKAMAAGIHNGLDAARQVAQGFHKGG